MKTVAFVPIKLNNERLPGKNVKAFSDGTPLIRILLDKLALLKGRCLDEIYVYCSDEQIKEYLPEKVQFLQRPEFLDQKTTKGRQIYEEFVKTIPADVYVLAHATTPFVTVEHIRECVKKVQEEDYDSAFCAQKHQTFFWRNNRPMNFELSNPPRTQDMEPIYTEVPTPYVFTKEAFEKYHARTGVNPYICECSEIECVDIDYPDDFQIADAIYTHIISKNSGSEGGCGDE